MASLKRSYQYQIILGVILVVSGCSVEKNTNATRFYHSLTSRYNIYFNGYESYQAGLDKISASYRDDYSQLIRTFEYSDPSTVQLCSSDMETAINKASKLISLKSITAKPEIKNEQDITRKEREFLNRKEFNEWVDDSYLLIGKARFHKHEYSEAVSLFEYCITTANDPEIKEEAAIWLARIYNETGRYNESLRILNELTLSGGKRSLLAMYYTTLADHYIKQKRYEEATDPLKQALDHIRGKRDRYRLTYLLAQLYEETGNTSMATSLYQKVIRMNPPYEVEFNARINNAGVFDISSGDPKDIKKELRKMMNNSKNRDFRDQIYYAMGNISMKEGNEKEALDFYTRSASAGSGNQNQRIRSYLTLADYYYNKTDYLKAGQYYDSAFIFLDNSHPDYESLRIKSQNLNTLVSHLSVIQTEDSLQRVARMTESERRAIIAEIIADVTREENAGNTDSYTDRYNMGQFYENERRFQDNIDQEGKWYFYNQAALTFGRTEFLRRWGERRLEDNWRRSNKAIAAASGIADNEINRLSDNNDTTTTMTDNKNPDYYLRRLPLTDSLMNISNNKIAYALLEAGKAYAEVMSDPEKAVETLESLNNRYPENELVPEALYNLYIITNENNIAGAQSYKQRLTERFPENEFARILSDPDYYKKKMDDLEMSEQLYQQTYDAYLREEYSSVLSLSESALEKYPEDILAPKFSLLHAYSAARMYDEKTYRDELNELIRRWPGTEESKRAGELMAFLDKEVPELKAEEEKVIAKELYSYDITDTHLFALVINDPVFNINLATFDVISYNIDNYTNDNYRTSGELVDNRYIIITVSGFSDYSESLNYYNGFRTEQLVRNPSGSEMFTFLISNTNLNILAQDKNPDRYQLFFIENYLDGPEEDN